MYFISISLAASQINNSLHHSLDTETDYGTIAPSMCLLGIDMTFKGNSLCLSGQSTVLAYWWLHHCSYTACSQPEKTQFTFSYFLLFLNEDLATVIHTCVTFRMNYCNIFYPKGCQKIKMKAVADSSCSSSPIQKWTHRVYPTDPLWSVLAFQVTEQSQDTGLLTWPVQAITKTTWKYKKKNQ